jgi:DNA-binding NarL/FixJ family response regulator
MSEPPVRVLLADDHAAVRAGLRLLLERHDDIEVVGEASDGQAAIMNARALRPDVVLMDIRMPGTDGIAATRLIVAEQLAEVLILTTFDLDDYVFGALRAGAAGFLLKTADAATLVGAVRRVAAGDGVLAPEVTRRVLERLGPAEETDVRAGAAELDQLTEREREVLTCLGLGLSNQEIAERLGISASTTKTHVSRVLAKTGSSSRMQAAILARDTGLV